MHYKAEVILPHNVNPSDIPVILDEALAEFHEEYEDEDGHTNDYGFYDWFVIGGRFAGAKLEARFDQESMEKFYAALREKEITVSGFVAGKQTLNPESQIPMVDKLWREHFPNGGDVCPLFSHYNNQYENSEFESEDICKVSELPEGYTASRFIVVNRNSEDTEWRVNFMLASDFFNGTNFQDTAWDGTLKDAFENYESYVSRYKEELAKKWAVRPESLSVTIDYHS